MLKNGFLNWVCLIKTGSTNPRKRGRETSVATEITPSMIPFSLQQSQPPQLIDLSQLHNHNHNHHPNVVSTGLRLSFGDQQQQQQQLQQHHHNQQQQNCHSSPSLFSVLAEDFVTQIKQQRDELDQFLQAQVIIFTLLRLVYRNFESSRTGFLEFFYWAE